MTFLLPALVIVTFVFAGQEGTKTVERTCKTERCIEHIIRHAEREPTVVRYQVLARNDLRLGGLGIPAFEEQVDLWKQ